MESLQKEKQIMVDESFMNHGFYNTSNTTIASTPSLLPLSMPKFMSLSLPNSANSSPLLTSKRKSKGVVVESQSLNQASNMTLNNQFLLLQEIQLRKSKSCGEGRASTSPFDEFDIFLAKPSFMEHDYSTNRKRESFSKTEVIEECNVSDKEMETNADEEGFKCSALCMYLPGFGKAKSVKTKKEGIEIESTTISRRVSLEKFECGSWSSSKLFNDIERDTTSSYFDLPMELIKESSGISDVHAPITSAFVFEKDIKGVLKNGSSRTNARKSDTSSPNHVRFSISSSTFHHPPSPASCNTPCLKEDFNAFLEAQST
ncbi:uncharacterized protein [Cicer arietinum]|uniref:Uncharacterized protein LOC101503125 n=1 Tax=Cicer arietinum TaxID=3827 RepID=A0A1S2YTF4_CICAR|nr:uncharacterized protein LOC101503125 [Cicer arietinum]